MKILIIICLFMRVLFAQEIEFEAGKSYSLNELKAKFKVHEVEIFNYHINQLETFYAFSFNEIMNSVYHSSWITLSSHVEVSAKDDYKAYIGTYKFRFRVPYLAFEKKYSKSFTTVFDYNKVLDLAPFFIIWKEHYKAGDAQRTSHWVYGVKKIALLRNVPLKIMPELSASENVFKGYDNFFKQCIQCHAIDGFGGNKSFSIFREETLKKADKYLMRFISHPKYFDKNSKMPPFPVKITRRTERIRNIMSYIRYISKRDFKSFEKSLPSQEKRDKIYLKLKTRIDNLE